MLTWSVVYDDIPVAVQPMDGRTINEFQRRNLQVNYSIYTPTTVALQTGDRVVVGSTKYLVQAWGDMAGKGRVFVMHCLLKS